ncbi:hypothetical protein ACFHPP_28645, partial [Falsiroseomonas sp. E2-1-a20]
GPADDGGRHVHHPARVVQRSGTRRQFWGWLSDRVGGLWTVFIGGLTQTVGMLGFLATQDEAGLFFAAAAYGLGFGGIVPAYVLAVRELFPAVEASWRVRHVIPNTCLRIAAFRSNFWFDPGAYLENWRDTSCSSRRP